MAEKKESIYPWIALTLGVIGGSIFLIRHLDEFRHIRAACISAQGLPAERAVEALAQAGAQEFKLELGDKSQALTASRSGDPKAWAEFLQKLGQVPQAKLYARRWKGVQTHRSCWGELAEGKFTRPTFE